MNRRQLSRHILVSLFFLIATACAPASPAPAPVDGIEGLGEFLDALRAAGATVETATKIEQPFFPVAGQIVRVNGAEVQAFEFANEADRREVSDTISETGDQIGTSIVDWIDQPNLWATGRLIVIYIGRDQAIINLITGVLGDPITTPAAGERGLQADAVLEAQQWLAQRLNVPVAQVTLVQSEQVEWPDSCLGLAQPDEACLQVITPGWRVVVEVNGQTYEIHTNDTGTAVRVTPPLAR
jgi:hypothetical protein